MSSLAENVMNGAQDAQNQAGHTVGDAMQAYHIAATAEHARQELDMEKQKNDMAKGNWVMSQLDGIGKQLGNPNAHKIMVDAFVRQAPQVIPGFDPKIGDLLKDPEVVRHYAAVANNVLSQGGITSPEQSDSIVNTMGSAQKAAEMAQTLGQQRAMIQAAQMKSQQQEGRVNAMQDNATQAAADRFDKDPNLQKLLPMGQSLGRDLSTLNHNTKEHPVTYQTLHESLMNVANVLGAGSLSDARVNSITPHVSDEVSSKINQFFGSDPNVAADPKYVDYVRNLVSRIHGAVKSDVGDRADQIANSRDPQFFHNPNISAINASKQQYYKSGSWMQRQQDAAAQAQAQQQQAAAPAGASPNPTPYGGTPKEIEANYQKFLATKAHQTAGGNY